MFLERHGLLSAFWATLIQRENIACGSPTYSVDVTYLPMCSYQRIWCKTLKEGNAKEVSFGLGLYPWSLLSRRENQPPRKKNWGFIQINLFDSSYSITWWDHRILCLMEHQRLCRRGGKEQGWTHTLHVSHFLMHMLHCLIELHL